MINSIFNNLRQNTQNTFNGYGANDKFDLTKIDGIPCAYCGEKMFSLSKYDKALGKAKTIDKMFSVGKMYENYLNDDEYLKLNFLYQGQNPQNFKYAIRKLFIPHTATIEHIIPKSNGGIDNLSNYITTCYKCNSNRKNVDLVNLLNNDTNIAKNIQNHINYLKTVLPQLIRNRKISPEYSNYLEILAKSLNKASKGQLNITI